MYRRLVDKQRLKRQECIVSTLRRADFDQEFSLVFQPQMDGRNDRLYAVEALLRWYSPTLGSVSAAEFIPLAEQYGVIHRITLWVIRQSVAYLLKWRQLGFRVQLAINISVLDLEHPYLLRELTRAVVMDGLEPAQLTLEVTETAPMRDPALAAQHVTELIAAGFKVALDDFGSGHAHLMQLGQLPVSEVKLDRSLIQALEAEVKSAAGTGKRKDQGRGWWMMLKSVIELAHSLGLQVVAEGVEDAQIKRLLQQAGCDYLQGYYFSKPLTEADFLRWLSQQRPDPAADESEEVKEEMTTAT
ncbi:hypothetical protein CWE12_03895 [Aliidiomarina sedimenti]|uniref:EAL domain-containing protein n=1 Tax=Aliidiomarina sedimenti TaxID=1933879 RepID=A0ABY0C2V0_9GAMM|nr:EAL domain-containing protein [Aliidiomarina sedimenti]RUO32141.1 hypothetical protein CWE12_03895 [Aliidiomarina sedimenti]